MKSNWKSQKPMLLVMVMMMEPSLLIVSVVQVQKHSISLQTIQHLHCLIKQPSKALRMQLEIIGYVLPMMMVTEIMTYAI